MDNTEEWGVFNRGAINGSIPISIGDSLWIAREHSNGIAEIYPDFNGMAVINYPQAFTKDMDTKTKDFRWNSRHLSYMACKYHGTLIVIINPVQCRGIVFNTQTRKVSDCFEFGAPRDWKSVHETSCIIIGDFLHIDSVVRSQYNEYKHEYIIFSMIDKTAAKFKKIKSKQELCPAVFKTDGCYNASNKSLISGFMRHQSDQTTKDTPAVIVDIISKFCKFELFGIRYESLYIGKLGYGDPEELTEWKKAPQYTLKNLGRDITSLRGFGYIHHGSLIVIFGGEVAHCVFPVCLDGIYILHLCDDKGWIESPIKCPMKARYRAVVDGTQRVHLFVWERPEQYCIELKNLIPPSMCL